MGARHADRIWMIGGVVVVALMLVAAWFLLISPKYAEADDVQVQSGDAQTQLVTLRKRITELKKEQAALPALKASLAKKQLALPSDSGVPAFLDQLQAAGTATGVEVTGVAVSSPVQMINLPAVWALPITLTATGSAANLQQFLTTLQTGQSRAVLIEKANLGGDTADSKAGSMSLSVSLNAYVAPPAGTKATTK